MRQLDKELTIKIKLTQKRNTDGHEPIITKINVFNILLNELIVSASLILSGRLFHSSADATANVHDQ